MALHLCSIADFSKQTKKKAPTSTQINLAPAVCDRREKLPMHNFELIEHIEDKVILNQILKTSEDSLIGFILKVDLDYPEELHDSHQD